MYYVYGYVSNHNLKYDIDYAAPTASLVMATYFVSNHGTSQHKHIIDYEPSAVPEEWHCHRPRHHSLG